MTEILFEVPDAAALAATLIEITNSVTQGAETIEIFTFMEAADESLRQGGKPVALADVLAKAKAEAAKLIK